MPRNQRIIEKADFDCLQNRLFATILVSFIFPKNRILSRIGANRQKMYLPFFRLMLLSILSGLASR
jgi:hypothetical protein